MTDKHVHAEQKTLKFWLNAQKSVGKNAVQPQGFVIRLPNGTQDLFYTEQGAWDADFSQARTFTQLEDAATRCDQLQAEPDRLPLDDINPMMADLGIVPQLQVMFWGKVDNRVSYIRVLW